MLASSNNNGGSTLLGLLFPDAKQKPAAGQYVDSAYHIYFAFLYIEELDFGKAHGSDIRSDRLWLRHNKKG